tara:strand:+ start:2191 stop:3498 length:1308 start_codon:yes stop_codon:yes gene_type:complete
MNTTNLAQDDRLKKFVSGGARNLGGQVQFLGLDEVKDKLGDRWKMKQDFIRTLCQRTIKPHIGKSDICLEYGELGFVILFGDLTDEAATLKCGLIKAEILRQLRGDDELKNVGVRTTVGDLASGALKATDLGDLLEKAEKKQKAEQTEQADGAALDYTNSQKKRLDAAQAVAMRTAMGEDNVDPFSVFEEDVDQILRDIDFGFLPLVNLKSGVISIFHCSAVRLDAFNRIVKGHDVLPHQDDEKSSIELDRMCLARAKIGLMDMTMRKRIALVSIPVSYATMSRAKARQEFVTGLASIPVELQRYLVLTLTGFPEGVPTSALTENVRLLKKYVRGIAARVPSNRENLMPFRDAGVQIVGFKFAEADMANNSMFQTLTAFKKAAAKAGLHTFVRNLKSKELVRAAIDMEYDYFSGPVIADISDYVGPVREVDLTAY